MHSASNANQVTKGGLAFSRLRGSRLDDAKIQLPHIGRVLAWVTIYLSRGSRMIETARWQSRSAANTSSLALVIQQPTHARARLV